MIKSGVFSPDERIELIRGEIVEMPPIGYEHAFPVARLDRLFNRLVNDQAIVWVQNPVQVNDYSEPLPDVTLLERRNDFYAQANPQPTDVLLIIEVADSSVEYEYGNKKFRTPKQRFQGYVFVCCLRGPAEKAAQDPDPTHHRIR